jgi:hypothetical protein
MLKELATREEVSRTGVYVLAGPDPENPTQDMIYAGEGYNVFKRITAHDKARDKEFWTRCVAVISNDLNLTKSHVRYLESRIIEKGHASGRARLSNETAPPLPPMIEEQKLVAIPDRPLCLFAEDIAFKSPSAGAAIVNAGNINGQTAWKVSLTKQTYADWHQSQLPEQDGSDGQ